MNQTLSQFFQIGADEREWKRIYELGALFTFVSLFAILLDVVIGNLTGGDLSALPQTAAERLVQLHDDPLLGLYNLDLLNALVQFLILPGFFALYAAHRQVDKAHAMLALLVFLFGSVILVANNTALPMLELSRKYFATSPASQKALYAAAGEAMLARGAHGSPGIFPGFFIPNLANLMMSLVMLKGQIFSRTTAWLGITGSILMLLYVALVNFVAGTETMATTFAMPGGLMLMAWMILYSIKLFKLSTMGANS
jgi:hypothetical protein